MAAFCLEVHARYQCRHAGACCRNWAVPAEPHVVHVVESRNLRRAGVTGDLFAPASEASASATRMVARDRHGDCVFFEREAGRLCIIHREAGAEALPAACRHFPRKVLHDARGTLISLSHFCPTAAAMLMEPRGLTIVDAHAPLVLNQAMEGLDASAALPPLLRPGLLCDLAGYEAWERAALATFAQNDVPYESCLETIAAATDLARGWQPGSGSLVHRVETAFRLAEPELGQDPAAQRRAIETVGTLTAAAVAGDMSPIDKFEEEWERAVGSRFGPFDTGMKQYLGARLFANWVAYQGRGLRTIVEWLRTCAAVVRHQLLQRARRAGSPPSSGDFIEAVRSADLLLLHVLDTAAFARHVARIEGPNPA